MALALKGTPRSATSLKQLLAALVPRLPRSKSLRLVKLAHFTLRQELRLTKKDFKLLVRTILGEHIVVLQAVVAYLGQKDRRCIRTCALADVAPHLCHQRALLSSAVRKTPRQRLHGVPPRSRVLPAAPSPS